MERRVFRRLMERSSQTDEMRIDDIWIFISPCTHNDMTTPLPRCSMLVCMCSRRLCGIYVVRIPSRSVSSFYANIECSGERGFFTGIVACRTAWMPFANFFPSTVPLDMVMHCTVSWTRDRYVCPYKTRPRVCGLCRAGAPSRIHSRLKKQTNPTNPTNPDFTHAQKAD